MPNDGQIVFEVELDGKKAKIDLRELTSAIQKETVKWDDAAKKGTSNMTDSFSRFVKKGIAGISAVKIAKDLLDVGKASIQAASDLQEVQNVVDVTFGESAGEIEAWAKRPDHNLD